MTKHKYSKKELQFNNVLKYQSKELSEIEFSNLIKMEESINESEKLIHSLGYDIKQKNIIKSNADIEKQIIIPEWMQLCAEAEGIVGTENKLEEIFTEDELKNNELFVQKLYDEYKNLYKLDVYDMTISVSAGLLGAAIDILLIGIPEKSSNGIRAKTLSNYIRDKFDERFPTEEMEKLAFSKISKVPYDAQDNRHTNEYVEGLSTYYHRLISLGHDPLIGFIVGIFDILTGRMTTLDKKGNFTSQVMQNYSDRKESDIFTAIAKQVIHLKSDITTSMGLPAPMMGLFNLLQFGSIGEEEQTIAEIVQSMYYEGYDFINFCALSIPVMVVEVTTILGYAIKCKKEGRDIKNIISSMLKNDSKSKLITMLFISHSASVAINAGKICFTKNPMAINYPQWFAFGKYSYKQLKYVIFENADARNSYVSGRINQELKDVYNNINLTYEEYAGKNTI